MRKAKQVKPRREPAAVTIGNLERAVHHMTQRVNDLVVARDNYQKLASEREQRIAGLLTELMTEQKFRRADVCRLEEAQAKLASTEQKFEGYRMAIEDMRE